MQKDSASSTSLEALHKERDQLLQQIEALKSELDASARIVDALTELAVHRSRMQVQSLNLATLAQDVVAQLRQRSPQRRVRVDIDPELRCQGDEALMRTALGHLIGNAWKFTAHRPDAWIRIGRHRDAQRKIPAFYVADNGIGVDMSHCGRLGAPLQDEAGGSFFESAGVGLAVAERIIRRHGGELWSRAQARLGSTFSFTLASRDIALQSEGSDTMPAILQLDHA